MKNTNFGAIYNWMCVENYLSLWLINITKSRATYEIVLIFFVKISGLLLFELNTFHDFLQVLFVINYK